MQGGVSTRNGRARTCNETLLLERFRYLRVPGRSREVVRAADAARADHSRDEVEVEAHAEERPVHAGGADVLLGRPVVTPERERVVRRRAEEREVDDPSHSCGHGGIDRGPVAVDPVRRLRRRDQEQGRDAVQRLPHLVRRAVIGRDAHVEPSRGTRGIADDQPRGVEQRDDAPADLARGSRDGDHGRMWST
jgi:hypothetical protein